MTSTEETTQVHVDGIALIISIFFGSIITLLIASFYILHNDIEYALMSEVTDQLDQAGYQMNVDFTGRGRDGIIRGSVEDKETIEEIIAIAESVEGVRMITSELTISKEEEGDDDPIELEGLDLQEIKTINNKGSVLPSITGVNEDKPIDTISLISETPLVTADKIFKIQSPITHEGDAESDDNLTETTQSPIIRRVEIYFKKNETKLSPEHKITLYTVVKQLNDSPFLFIEMASFHKESSFAIKQFDHIKNFLKKQNIDEKRFNMIWHDSERVSKVQLRLFNKK